MMPSPSIPNWNALHPLIIYFPIVVLLIAPLFVVMGAVTSPPKGRPFLLSALILMVLGTASLILAIETGEAACQVAGLTPALVETLKQHRDLAQTTQVLFLLLTVAFASLLFVPGSFAVDRQVNAALLAAFLIFYATGAIFLINTARRGGRLVHEFGIRAPVTSSATAVRAADELIRGGCARRKFGPPHAKLKSVGARSSVSTAGRPTTTTQPGSAPPRAVADGCPLLVGLWVKFGIITKGGMSPLAGLR